MEYIGTVDKIGVTQQVSEKFRKRDFTITDSHDQYPQFIQFEVDGDRCDILDPIKEGDKVEVKFALKGRKWTNPEGVVKVFNTLRAYAIVKLEGAKFKGETLTPEPGSDPGF